MQILVHNKALSRTVEKTINGMTIQYLYDGLDIVQEIENGMVTINYIRTLNIDEPLARISSDGMIRYYHADALGSVIALTDDLGQVRTQYNYSPFGETEIFGEMSDNPFQHTGRENDGTGLYYYRARYYSAGLKRFISEDPIDFAGGDVNLYGYVLNDPVNLFDPFGLQSMTDTWVNYGTYGANWSEFNKERNIPPFNLSLTAGGSFHVGMVGLGAYTGLAIDNAGNICLVSNTCYSIGWGYFGTLGIEGGIGTGKICEGTTEMKGGFIEGGPGITFSGSLTTSGNNISAGKGLLGIGGGLAGSYISCQETMICF